MLINEPVLRLDSLRGDGRDPGRCKIGIVLGALSPGNQEVINQALSGSETEFPSGKIVSALGSMKIVVTSSTVIKHRRGQCRCMKVEETVND